MLAEAFDAAFKDRLPAADAVTRADPSARPDIEQQRRADALRIAEEEARANPNDADAQRIYQDAIAKNGGTGKLTSAFDQAFAGVAPSSGTPAAPPRSMVSQIPGMPPEPAAPAPFASRRNEPISEPKLGEPSNFDNALGRSEALLSMATGAVALPISSVVGLARGMVSGKFGTPEGAREAQDRQREVMESLTYSPRTRSGQETLANIGGALAESKLQGVGPTEGIALSSFLNTPKAPRTPPGLKVVSEPVSQPGMASVGAAATSLREQALAMAAKASPELREAVGRVADTADLSVLARHVDADTLPVPVRLTKGQATQDLRLLSDEQNKRGITDAKGKTPLADRFQEQNKALIENVDAIKERAAPDVYATTKPEIGEIVIDAYKAKDASLNADISAKYKALTDANGGNFPLDAKQFVNAADAALHKGLLYDHVPPGIRATLDRLKESGGMTFENFESMRTNLARIQRSQTVDGNVKAAAGVIRDSLEQLPMPKGAEALKPLADAARKAARDRFALIEGDPAYKAVVRGTISADKLIDKFVTSSDLKTLERIKQNLAHDPAAQQALSAGALNQLKLSAGIIDNAGNFSQAGYNKALEAIRPKLGVLFEPEQRQQVEALGRVARYTQAQPRGSYVNNSNTAVTLMGEAARQGAEGAANIAAHGIPVGSWVRKIAKNRAEQTALREMLEPGAGVAVKSAK